jgi:elongation factor P
MKQQANLIRAGQVIDHDGRRWTVLKQQIITPGKGGAFIQVEMRDLKTGNKTNERWRTADTVEVVGIHLPQTAVLEVVAADPVVKGQTASSSYKPAILANGVKTMVPPFVEAGERIVVKIEDASYVERFKG